MCIRDRQSCGTCKRGAGGSYRRIRSNLCDETSDTDRDHSGGLCGRLSENPFEQSVRVDSVSYTHLLYDLHAGQELFKAAYMGVFLHGSAGDAAAARFGARGMTSVEIIEGLFEVLKN